MRPRSVCEVARQQHERAVLADSASEQKRRAARDGRQQCGQDDAPENGETTGAERCGGLFDFRVELLEHGLHRTDDEREAHERSARNTARSVFATLTPIGLFGP